MNQVMCKLPQVIVKIFNEKNQQEIPISTIAEAMNIMHTPDPLVLASEIAKSQKISKPTEVAAKIMFSVGGHINASSIPESILNGGLELGISFEPDTNRMLAFAEELRRFKLN